LIADGNTHLTITSGGTSDDFGALKFTNTTAIGHLTIAGDRSVDLGSDLAVEEVLTLTDGELNLNGFALTLQGGISQSVGELVSTPESELIIDGTGALPGDLPISGGNMGTVTMNRLGETLATSS